MTTTLTIAIDKERKRRVVAATIAKHYGSGDHPGGTPQTTHGRGARGSSSTDIKEATDEKGGITVSPPSGERPTKGFAVALPDKGLKLPKARATSERVSSYIRDNWDTISRPGNFLGTWKDDDAGVVWLDVSKVIDSDNYADAFDKAVSFGQKHGELAIYDLQSGSEIQLNEKDINSYREGLAA